MTLRFLTAGESHGPELLVIVEGMPAGVTLAQSELDHQLRRRQGGHGRGARSTKIESDAGDVVAGVIRDGDLLITTGAPVGIRIINRDFANQPPRREPLRAPRPGHADLAGGVKYGVDDFRIVRERASARETAARVAAGALARALLTPFGVRVGSFVTAIGDVDAALGVDALAHDAAALHALATAAEDDPVRCPDAAASARMVAAIDAARVARETLGGVVVIIAAGVPIGLGSHVHWDRRLNGRLLQAVGSIHAVKGAEIGAAFDVAARPGSAAVDSVIGAALARPTNHAGGIEGGMSNGAPILVRAAMKPLSSVRTELESVDISSGAPANPGYVRSDICAVPAAAVVGEAMVAWVLAEALCERFGGDRLDIMLAARAAADAAPFGAGGGAVYPAAPLLDSVPQ